MSIVGRNGLEVNGNDVVLCARDSHFCSSKKPKELKSLNERDTDLMKFMKRYIYRLPHPITEERLIVYFIISCGIACSVILNLV